ncbi:hypothetical protein BD779DRAFT_610961 [Infundibulicybe gibba]|nr:hypothetical protein BD779DRAFT_610961 [Infundibulicybe gibba]
MAFPRAANLQIHRSKLNIAGRDINNYHDDRWKQDTRGCVRSAMGDHLHTDAYHDSGMRRDPSRCYPGTREAALETISRWARDPESHCFWLHGPAGAGKSAIAQTFAEQCDQDNLTLGATYFFTKGSTGGPVHGTPPLFPTLAYQLVLKFPGLDEHLWGAIDADQTIFKRSLSVQLEKLIVQPFLKLGDTSPPAVVVIDGLDECDGDSIQGEIVRLIMGLERHSLPLLFLISSRPEFEIRRAFESFPSPSSARLPLDKTLHPDRDIRHFLVSEFERMYVEMGMPPVSQLPWPSTEDIEELVRKSSGHFIYAATVIRFVQEDHAHPMDRLDALLQIQSESISSSPTEGVIANSAAFQELDRLYLHILRKYRNRAELPKILRAIMYFGFHDWTAGSSDEIERVFGLTHRSIHFMLRDLHSIISVPVSGGHPLRFLHASFSDFLTDPERSQEFYFDINHFNAELACGYMRLIVAFRSPTPPGVTCWDWQYTT